MADTKLNQIGPDTGQLSKNLSFVEKTQIGAIRNTGTSISTTPGKITGDVTKSLSNVNNTAKSTMEIGADLAAKMESAGAVRKNTRDFIASNVPKAVENKRALYSANNRSETSITKTRPEQRKKSIEEIIRRNKNDVIGILIEELGLQDLSYGGLQFPSDLDTQAPVWLTLQFGKYSRTDPFAPGSLEGTTEIHLPIPENFSFNSNISLQQSDTGVYGEILKNVNPTVINQLSQGDFSGASSALIEQLKAVTGQDASEMSRNVAMRAAFASLNSAEPIVGGLASQVAGSIPNPHPTVFFKGMELRQFQWNWKLVPRNAKDANLLKAIIFLLRYFCIPQQSGGGSFLDYPYLIKPKVKGADTLVYGTFKRAMVNQLSFNFSAEGSSAYFVNGDPVAVNIGLNFMEVENYDGQ